LKLILTKVSMIRGERGSMPFWPIHLWWRSSCVLSIRSEYPEVNFLCFSYGISRLRDQSGVLLMFSEPTMVFGDSGI
jgi:hypothetical protein